MIIFGKRIRKPRGLQIVKQPLVKFLDLKVYSEKFYYVVDTQGYIVKCTASKGAVTIYLRKNLNKVFSVYKGTERLY